MRKDKVKAYQLRRQGKSYKDIREALGIPISTLSDWFKSEEWSQQIKDELKAKARPDLLKRVKAMAAANKKKWHDWHVRCQEEAVAEFPKYKNDPLFISGIMLYWGEGDKKVSNSIVCLANSDPELIRIFFIFLNKILNIPLEKISASLILYPDLIDSVQKNLWSKLTRVPLSNFKKSVFIKGRHPTKRNSYGVCLIRVNSRALKEKIMKWIELYQLEFRARG